ncbi:hypothetical protein Cme02nite_56030 [Catellatospora methionotrophica]|uniref:Uncharacterized protein n=1 Tax=Catellatospora methionotrophica TaxID=121620 RepID=A0A8J3LLA1_9ACTN|nr:hypothetical protein Cme02nite_56030 [Catellatospora methionotrophica]
MATTPPASTVIGALAETVKKTSELVLRRRRARPRSAGASMGGRGDEAPEGIAAPRVCSEVVMIPLILFRGERSVHSNACRYMDQYE